MGRNEKPHQVKNFRLSLDSIAKLGVLSASLQKNETEIIEEAIAFYYEKQLDILKDTNK